MIKSCECDSFSERLLTWFDAHGRHDLPWQHPATPYRVWVSEVMLQQTQVATVIPYFERFMASFPTLEALAKASLEQVLARWSGLGYYARGRHLHKAAQRIWQVHGGEIPADAQALMQLPGIGRSTAHAILSLAFGQPVAICDGNVKRVLSRWLALAEPIDSKAGEEKLWQVAQSLQSHRRAAAYTQAIMDLGATVCTRNRPKCEICPVAQDCQARLSGQAVTQWPVRRPKAGKRQLKLTFYLYLSSDNALWLEPSQADSGIWAGLYRPPQTPLPNVALPAPRRLPPLLHELTHQRWLIHPYLIQTQQPSWHAPLSQAGIWYNPEKMADVVARPALVDKLLSHCRLHLAGRS